MGFHHVLKLHDIVHVLTGSQAVKESLLCVFMSLPLAPETIAIDTLDHSAIIFSTSILMFVIAENSLQIPEKKGVVEGVDSIQDTSKQESKV